MIEKKFKTPSYDDKADIPELISHNNTIAEGWLKDIEEQINNYKAKLDGIEAGAQVNTITGVKGEAESNYRMGDVNITKDNIGLGNVPNVVTNDQTPTFTQASSRANIASGEKLSVIFGKIKKWFADLKPIAFSGSYDDLEDTPFVERIPGGVSFIQGDTIDLLYPIIGTNNKIINFEQTSVEFPLSDVAWSGSYNDLTDRPPLEQTQAEEWTLDGELVCNNIFASSIAASDIHGFNSNDCTSIDEITENLKEKSNTATIVVGSPDTISAWNNVDFKCTGTNDQIVIQQAINALPEDGGKIVLREGIYNISGSIIVNKDNVTIEGMGIGSTVISTSSVLFGTINIQRINGCVRNCSIKYTASAPNGAGIYLTNNSALIENVEILNFSYGVNATARESDSYHIISRVRADGGVIGIHANTKRCLISNCISKNNTEHGIRVEGSYNTVLGNQCIDNNGGIIVTSGGSYNKISDNYIIRGTGQASDYSSSQNTIQIQSGSVSNAISDNYIPGKNYVNGGGSTNEFSNNKYQ